MTEHKDNFVLSQPLSKIVILMPVQNMATQFAIDATMHLTSYNCDVTNNCNGWFICFGQERKTLT